MNEFLKKVKENKKYVGVGGCVLALIGLFLPFATVSATMIIKYSQSVKFIDGDDGKLVLLALVAAGVLFFIDKIKEKFTLIPLGIALAITIYDGLNIASKTKDLGSYVKASLGIGFYITLLGILVAGATLFLDKILKDDKTATAAPQPAPQQPISEPVQPVINEPVQSEPVQPTVTEQVPSEPTQPTTTTEENKQDVEEL